MKRPAIFLDRDGVVTVERGYVTSLDELKIFSYARTCVEKMHFLNYYAIVVTNQSAVARGLLSENDLKIMNERLKAATGIDEVYYCPHHPNGMVERYTKVCCCRKPMTGLIEKACAEYDIDLDNSFFVGDRASDIITGKKKI